METSQNGIDLIKRFEGLQTEAYRCPAGILTIGYGHTHGVKMGDKCSPSQAEEWLRQDCLAAEMTIRMHVKKTLNQNQFDALVSFIFNLGAVDFIGSTLLKKLNAGDYAGAASEFGRWVNVCGRKFSGLVKRRAAEKTLFLS